MSKTKDTPAQAGEKGGPPAVKPGDQVNYVTPSSDGRIVPAQVVSQDELGRCTLQLLDADKTTVETVPYRPAEVALANKRLRTNNWHLGEKKK